MQSENTLPESTGPVSAHLTDHVLPPLPLRQWVLSLPKRIHPFLPHDPLLAGDVLRVLIRAGECARSTQRPAQPALVRRRTGASFLKRLPAGVTFRPIPVRAPRTDHRSTHRPDRTQPKHCMTLRSSNARLDGVRIIEAPRLPDDRAWFAEIRSEGRCAAHTQVVAGVIDPGTVVRT
jgi:hypothetical protein